MEAARKHRMVEAFEEWAQDRGLLARLPMLRQATIRILDDLGDEPMTSLALEQIVSKAKAAGTNAVTLDELEKTGRAFLDFAKATGVIFRKPTADPKSASAVAPVAAVAKPATEPVKPAVQASVTTPAPVRAGSNTQPLQTSPAFKPIAAPESQASFEAHLAKSQTEAAPKPGAIAAALVFSILLLGGLRWLHVVPVAPTTGAHVAMPEKGFAVIPPVGWKRITPELVAEAKQLGHVIPPDVERALFDKSIAISFTRGFEATFAPSFNVVVTNDKFPTINEAARAEAVKQLESMFKQILKSYRVVDSSVVVVDRIKSLEISGISTVPMNGLDTQIRTHQFLVPGKNSGFFLTFTSLESDFDALKSDSRRVLQSFVVMDRPPRFGPIVQMSLLCGMIGALVPLLLLLGRSALWYVSRGNKARA